ncbi:uncharacterized protein BO80DRAFT_207889 [Aspergillus ibericus CBS 121593]|uniref:Uncharacterized protein n=1 Tax=Aspergillus ibericus CBS 121593 TaxID=1448316 RepID=A0A395HAS8_9EURO|nr:hypothetical protein BO80DRAFT_207889 [Aspergillus ibericus CBS 121593]RAL04756.1 hypothetical protein BO80DRAFT_207889 [Aspergillus ibericus CBS 121593]
METSPGSIARRRIDAIEEPRAATPSFPSTGSLQTPLPARDLQASGTIENRESLSPSYSSPAVWLFSVLPPQSLEDRQAAGREYWIGPGEEPSLTPAP